jgi:hypothetical protein
MDGEEDWLLGIGYWGLEIRDWLLGVRNGLLTSRIPGTRFRAQRSQRRKGGGSGGGRVTAGLRVKYLLTR